MVGFLLAGFETTSTALGYCFHILAHHPDELSELQSELDEAYGDGRLKVSSWIITSFILFKNTFYLNQKINLKAGHREYQ